MIEIDITTPTKKLVEGAKTAGVKMPTPKGEIEVLPGHAEMITLLGTGVLSFTQDGVLKKFAVSYGFAEVRHDKVTVLAETAESHDDVDKPRAVKAQKKAEEALAGTLSEENFRKYQLKLQRAMVRQQVAL